MSRRPSDERADRARGGGVWAALCDQGGVSAVNFLTTWVVGCACPERVFGAFVLTWSLLFLLEGVRVSLVGSPVSVLLPRRSGRSARRYAGAATVIHLGAVGLGLIAFPVAALVARAGGDVALAGVLLAGTAAWAGWTMRTHVRGLAYAHLQPRRALAVDATYGVLQLGAVAALWAGGLLSAETVLLAVGGAQTAAAAAGLYLMRRRISLRGLDLKAAWAAHRRLGRWLLLGSLAYTAVHQLFPWLLAGSWGVEAAAAFGACLLPLSIARPLVTGLATWITPRLAREAAHHEPAALRATVARFQLGLLAALAPLAVALALGGGIVLDLLYDGRYTAWSGALALASAQLVVMAWAVPIQQAFLALERPHLNFASIAVGAGVAVTVGVGLTWTFGVMGAVAGMVASVLATALTTQLLYRRALRDQVLPAAPPPRAVGSALISG